jgi:hypothetical protein
MRTRTRRYLDLLRQALGIERQAWRLCWLHPERYEFSMLDSTAAYHRKKLRDLSVGRAVAGRMTLAEKNKLFGWMYNQAASGGLNSKS